MPGFSASHSAQRSIRPVSSTAARDSSPYTGARAGTSPAKAVPRPSSSIGWTSHSTATLDATAHTLTLSPRSTSTGKVAAEAQRETQSESHTPPAKRRKRSTARDGFSRRLFGFFFLS